MARPSEMANKKKDMSEEEDYQQKRNSPPPVAAMLIIRQHLGSAAALNLTVLRQEWKRWSVQHQGVRNAPGKASEEEKELVALVDNAYTELRAYYIHQGKTAWDGSFPEPSGIQLWQKAGLIVLGSLLLTLPTAVATAPVPKKVKKK